MPGPVVIHPYDPEWPRIFERLRQPVLGALGDLAVTVKHTGSTAVPGLAAKPIMDMIAVVPFPDAVPEAIQRLATLGDVHQGDRGLPGREAFRSAPDLPAHHVYSGSDGSTYVPHSGQWSRPAAMVPCRS